MAFARQQPLLVYVAGVLAGLAALLGIEPPAGPVSTVVLSGIAAITGILACVGERRGLKVSWRTPLTDVSLVSAVVVTALAFSRHIVGDDPYRFHAVALIDGVALAGAIIAFVGCSLQYRSRLTIFGALAAAVTMIPIWCAALGLLATIVATLIARSNLKQTASLPEDQVCFTGRYRLPLPDRLPGLWSNPLSLGGIPLGLLGLAISVANVVQGNFSFTALAGAAIAAVVLLWLTKSYRETWLYVVGILATYFAIHSIAQASWFEGWSIESAATAHIAIASAISLLGWLIASSYAWWCNALLRRCAEEKEASVQLSRDYYSGLLCHVTTVIGLVSLAMLWFLWLGSSPVAWTLGSATLLAILFALAASAYRTRLGSYLSLIALTLAVFSGFQWLQLPSMPQSTVLAGLGFLAAVVSCLSYKRSPLAVTEMQERSSWLPAISVLPATGIDLWIRPLALYALVCSPIAVLSVMQGDSSWSVSNIWTRPAPLTYALASFTLLLSTRTFRIPVIYAISIGFAYAACHAAAQLVLNQGWIEIEAIRLHPFVGAGVSLVSCLIATSVTWAINRRIDNLDGETQQRLIANREFYAGILHHFVSVVAAILLPILAGLTLIDTESLGMDAPIHVLTATLLATSLCISGLVYHSRLHTYLALSFLLIAMLGFVSMWTASGDRIAIQSIASAVAALLFGISAWVGSPRKQPDSDLFVSDDGKGMRWRFNECWVTPPLPLVSTDRTLWVKPLAHVSVFLALAALAPVAMQWGRFPAWLTVMPIFLASCTWLIATFTFGFGLLGALDRLSSSSDVAEAAQPSDGFEKRLLYAMSILSFGVGVHATMQLTALRELPDRAAVAWHLVIAACLVLVGWIVATVISLRRKDSLVEGPRLSWIRSRRELYAGLLHHLVFAAGVGVLVVAAVAGLSSPQVLFPLAISSGLLTLHFALSGATYRSQLGSYLSLAALGLTIVQLSRIIEYSLGNAIAAIAVACSLLGLALMTIAAYQSRMGSRLPELLNATMSSRRLPATPWVSPPLPMRASTWSSLWFNPLRQSALVFVQLGALLIVANIAWRNSWDGWSMPAIIALFAAAMTCSLAAKLYETSIFTYLAAAILSVVVFPALMSHHLGDPKLGVAWSFLAVAFWIAGFAIEKWSGVGSVIESDEDSELLLTEVYERPLVRSSAMLAILAIFQSLYAWMISSPTHALTPLLSAIMGGALALLLNARSMNVLHRFSLGRMLVHLACLAMTLGVLIVTTTRSGLEAIGPNVAVTALIFVVIGLLLKEWTRSRNDTHSDTQASTLVFAEPLSTFGSMMAMAASVASLMIAVGTGGLDGIAGWTTSLAGWLDGLAIRPVALTFTVAAIVSLLTVRATRVVVWLDVAVVLGSTGLLLLANDAMNWSTATLTLVALVTMNGLVVIARFVRLRPAKLNALLGLQDASSERSFFQWPLVFATACLLLQTGYLLLMIVGSTPLDPGWTWLLNGLLCAVLFFHVMYLQPQPMLLHLLVASTVVGFFGACLNRGWDITADVALSAMGLLWGIIAIQFKGEFGERVFAVLRLPLSDEEKSASGRALVGWAVGMTGSAVAITLPIYWLVGPEFPNLPVTLLFAAMTSLLVGVRWQNNISVTAAAVLFPLCLLSACVIWLDPIVFRKFAALATASLSCLYVLTEFVVRRRLKTDEENGISEAGKTFFQQVGNSLIVLAHLSAAFAAVLTIASMMMLSPSPVFAFAMALVAVSWLWLAWEAGAELLVYTSVAAVFTAMLYFCMSLLGLTFSRSTLAAFLVIAYSFALYGLNVLIGRVENPRSRVFLNPTYYMALLAPVVLPLVMPLDQRMVAAFVLLAAGSFYLVVSQRSHARWTLYVAAVLFNLAIYLWIPQAKELTGLAQLYVIPAAITVLLLAQLHRHDLKPQALSGIRTAAAGAILAVSTFEVFMANGTGLLQFVAVLALSLAGIVAGIALRIRPFVTIGLAFLVINVLGQLGLQFQREGGVIRAVILIGVGVLVLSAMIFFNIHRERIMRQYRGFLADENWS